MKFLTKLIILLFSLLCLSANVLAAPDTYTFDSNHSYVLWHANHFGFSNPSGKWLVNGTLILDEDKPEDSKVNVTIQMANLITAIPEFDKHLKGKLFLDVDQYPKASFISNKVQVIGKDQAKVRGILTLHGVSKPVILNVKLNKIGLSPVTTKYTAGFSASTTIKRSDFGISTLIPGVSDDVAIDIEAEAAK